MKPKAKKADPGPLPAKEANGLPNIIDTLQEPVQVKPEPPKPLPVLQGSKEHTKVSEKENVQAWSKFINHYHLLVNSEEAGKRRAYEELILAAQHSGYLNYNQTDAIIARCKHQLWLLNHPEEYNKARTGAEHMQKVKGLSKWKQTGMDI